MKKVSFVVNDEVEEKLKIYKERFGMPYEEILFSLANTVFCCPSCSDNVITEQEVLSALLIQRRDFVRSKINFFEKHKESYKDGVDDLVAQLCEICSWYDKLLFFINCSFDDEYQALNRTLWLSLFDKCNGKSEHNKKR